MSVPDEGYSRNVSCTLKPEGYVLLLLFLSELPVSPLHSSFFVCLIFHSSYFLLGFDFIYYRSYYLGDNCIVFENFTVSIRDLMVANWVYWRRESGPVNGYLRPLNLQLMPWNFLFSNVIMYIDVYCHIIDKMT